MQTNGKTTQRRRQAGRIVWAAVPAIAILACGCGRKVDTVSRAKVVIETKPENDVQVLINGVSRGTTPVTLKGLPMGRVLVQLRKDKWKPRWEIVEIPEAGKRHLVFEMQRQVGYLTIESQPSFANVFLDDMERPLGDTPLVRSPVPVGRHMYEVRKTDYETLRQVVTIEADYRYRYHYKLTPKPARLQVYSSPTGARIWLNDEVQARTTPAGFELRPGTYRVGVHTRGHIMAEKVLKLGPNQSQAVELKMEEGDAPPGMVFVPAGEFVFGANEGAPEERPQQEVHLEAFYIDRYEVTNRQFRAVFPTYEYEEGLDNFPVTGVSFQRATAYAEAVGKRLPTEAEWEKAARGVDGRPYPWGTDFDEGLCNSGQWVTTDIREVGQYRGGASPYGCYDMAGNVYEWTSSWYKAYPGNAKIKKEYGQVFRVLRGGSCRSGKFDVRCPSRHFDRMDATRMDYGFRCVKALE